MNLGAVELIILFMIVVVPLLVGLGIALFLRSRRGDTEPSASHSALATLEQRYARGEISQAEFEQRRAVLSGQAPASDGFA